MARGANRRVRVLLFTFTLVFALILARAVWLQSVRAQSLEKLASGQAAADGRPASPSRDDLRPPRLSARDRRAGDDGVRQPARGDASPRWSHAPRAASSALDPDDVYRAIADRGKGFVYVQRQADPKAAARLQRMHLAGWASIRRSAGSTRRVALARRCSATRAWTTSGLAGLELSLDALLAGRSGKQTVVKDPYGRAVDVVKTVPERDGSDVYLTLDHAIQANAQLELWRAVHEWHAQAATAIVMNPRTGAVLAMAGAPGYDANDYPNVSQDLQRNRAITDTYEPGSTFKLVTVGGVLSDHLVTPSSEFTLAPEIQVADRTIHDAEPRDTVTYTVDQILAHSSNVGAITLAEMLTRQPKRDVSYWISRFGFGHKTGIDYPGESAGIVLPPSQWTGATIGNVPIGHGIAVTPVQMAAAYAAVANRGVWVQPHLVDHIGGSPRPAWKRRRIVSKGVATELTNMLRDVVIEGTGTEAKIPGYQVAGKTGTAAIPLPTGGYSDQKYVASFVGLRPGVQSATARDGDCRPAAGRDLRGDGGGARLPEHRQVRPAVSRDPSPSVDSRCDDPRGFHRRSAPARPGLRHAFGRSRRPVLLRPRCARRRPRLRRRGGRAGCVGLVVERELALPVPQLVVPDARAAMAVAADDFFGRPSEELVVAGVTGTNGKTTTTFLLYSILEAAGLRPGLLGTVESRVGGEIRPAVRTTPEAIDIQRMLREMLDAGDHSCVMEATSHGSEQRRLDRIRFDVLVFTNLTQDHLDFHGTMERYFEAKRRLFLEGRPPAAVNSADEWGRKLLADRPDALTYGFAPDAEVGPDALDGIDLRLRGRFNVENALGAMAAARLLGVDDAVIARGLEAVPGCREGSSRWTRGSPSRSWSTTRTRPTRSRTSCVRRAR